MSCINQSPMLKGHFTMSLDWLPKAGFTVHKWTTWNGNKCDYSCTTEMDICHHHRHLPQTQHKEIAFSIKLSSYFAERMRGHNFFPLPCAFVCDTTATATKNIVRRVTIVPEVKAYKYFCYGIVARIWHCDRCEQQFSSLQSAGGFPRMVPGVRKGVT